MTFDLAVEYQLVFENRAFLRAIYFLSEYWV